MLALERALPSHLLIIELVVILQNYAMLTMVMKEIREALLCQEVGISLQIKKFGTKRQITPGSSKSPSISAALSASMLNPGAS